VIAVVLSLFASAVSIAAAYSTWLAWRTTRDLARRYGDAIGLIVVIARADPAWVAPQVRAACDRMIQKHAIEVTIPTGERVH